MGSRKRVKQRRVHRRNLDDWSFIAIPLVMPSNFAKLNIRTPSVVHEVDKLPDASISFRTRANLFGKRKFGAGRKRRFDDEGDTVNRRVAEKAPSWV